LSHRSPKSAFVAPRARTRTQTSPDTGITTNTLRLRRQPRHVHRTARVGEKLWLRGRRARLRRVLIRP